MATKATRTKSSPASAEPVAPSVESVPVEEKKSRSKSNLIGRGYRGGSSGRAESRPPVEEQLEELPTPEPTIEEAPAEKSEALPSLRPLRIDMQQLRKLAEESSARIDSLAADLADSQALRERMLRQEALAEELNAKLSRYDELEVRLKQLEGLLQAVPKAPPAAAAPEGEAEQWMLKCVELEAQVIALSDTLEGREQELSEYAETVKSRDDEIAELSLFAEDLERKNNDVRAQLEAATQSRTQQQVLREEVARLQGQLAEKSSQLTEARMAAERQEIELEKLRNSATPASQTVSTLSKRLAAAHSLLDEIDVLLYSLTPEPPLLVAPLRRLRARFQELRGPNPFFRTPLNGGTSEGGTIFEGNEELMLVRQRLLEAHTRLETAERERDFAVSRLREQGGARPR